MLSVALSVETMCLLHCRHAMKSFCYALLLVVFDVFRGERQSIIIVDSPLTFLMMEQREKFATQGIPAEFVGELQQDIDSMQGVKEGKHQLVYISPKSLLSNT